MGETLQKNKFFSDQAIDFSVRTSIYFSLPPLLMYNIELQWFLRIIKKHELNLIY